MEKIFKNLDEQVEILKFKGLVINDVDFARDVLLRENYFFLNGYRHLFMTNNGKKFIPGTTFEELYSLFLFDRSFRNIIFKNLLIVENNMKSIISYQLSKKYGYRESEYLRPKNFNTSMEKQAQVNDVLKKMKGQVRVNGNQHSATMHYINNYGYIPLWIMVKVLSFGIMGELFAILKRDDQIDICNIYNVSVDDMIDYLPILSNYRNLCAHEDIVFEHRTQKRISNSFYHKFLNIEMDDFGYEYRYGKNDLFSLIIILKEMLTNEDFVNFMDEIEREINHLSYNLHTINIGDVIERMGFPKNYLDIKKVTRKVEIL